MHKYKEDKITNSYYIGTEIFFQIACRHPFTDGNKRTAYIASLFFAGMNLREINGDIVGQWVDDAGKIIETIAGWSAASDNPALKKMVFESGVIGKKSRPLREEDVKGFINHFLRNSIRIKVDKNGKKKGGQE